jgi:hypothetical protein
MAVNFGSDYLLCWHHSRFGTRDLYIYIRTGTV